jgi:hypothetical protein
MLHPSSPFPCLGFASELAGNGQDGMLYRSQLALPAKQSVIHIRMLAISSSPPASGDQPHSCRETTVAEAKRRWKSMTWWEPDEKPEN